MSSLRDPAVSPWPAWRALIVVMCLTLATDSPAQQVDPDLWITDGGVEKFARAGNTLYLAGAFSELGPNTGSGVIVDRGEGRVIPGFPRTAGAVYAAEPDGNGGWFIGGAIAGVNGKVRASVAHVRADGSVSDWNASTDGLVLALERSGDTLYVGGQFGAINGVARNNLGAISATTGEVLDWNPNVVDDRLNVGVHALAASRFGTIYVGGEYTEVAGEPRNSLAEIDRMTARPTAWNPDVRLGTGRGRVNETLLLGDTLYIGGKFGTIGLAGRGMAAGIDCITGLATEWNPYVEGLDSRYDGAPYVQSLAAGDGTMYMAGHFATVRGVARGGLAEVDRITGVPTAWDPAVGPRYFDLTPYVLDLAVTESSVFTCGSWQTVGGIERRQVAEIDRGTGLPTSWNPGANGMVDVVAVGDSTVFIGGRYTSIGTWVKRRCLAAIDLATGQVKDWDPQPDGLIVYDVLPYKDRVYVGGHFLNVGGRPHAGLAALDTLGGAALEDWAPQPNQLAGELAIAHGRLYVAGPFTSIAGVPRGHGASFDLATGSITEWDPQLDDDVWDLAIVDNVAYLGGQFRTARGASRRYAAAVEANSGELLPWNPSADFVVHSLAVKGDTVFMGGLFSAVGGRPRKHLAAVDAMAGQSLDWVADAQNANPYAGRVHDLALVGDTLFVSGSFDSINGLTRGGVAALGVHGPTVLAWDADLRDPGWNYPVGPGVMWTLYPDGNTLYVSGRFHRAGPVPAAQMAALSIADPVEPPPPPPPVGPAFLFGVQPNPLVADGFVRYALPWPMPVRIGVYDLKGRLVKVVAAGETHAAGPHEIPLRTESWGRGVYFCRLEAGGIATTRKFTVLR